MIKEILVHLDNFLYKVVLKNLLKTSKLGYGLVVTGAESGANFEHMYNNRPEGSFIIGRYVDKALLKLQAVEATRGRKEDIKKVLWNEVNNNRLLGKKTRVLDLASGGARYLRELTEYHQNGDIESICIDKNTTCVHLGEELSKKEGLKNIRFFRGDIFRLGHLRNFSSRLRWAPNVVIAAGLFIYFSNQVVEKMIQEIYDLLPDEGLLIFSSYEQLHTRKLMRKTMATSSGKEWTLYYRKPDYWRSVLYDKGFKQIFITRDQWQMNNIVSARK